MPSSKVVDGSFPGIQVSDTEVTTSHSVLGHTKEGGAGRESRFQATGLSRQKVGEDE